MRALRIVEAGMKYMRAVGVLLSVVLTVEVACAAAKPVPAFPGAEGFGAVATGGRGGRVLKVTHLGRRGRGSLNWAVQQKGPRIVVFDVSGVIQGNVTINQSDLTIAGQTAPGAGVTLEGILATRYMIKPPVHNVIIRFLRVRPPVHGGKWHGGDCLQITRVKRLMLDHISTSWSTDESIDLAGSQQVTVQWCSLEESDPTGHDKGQHNYGMLLGYGGADTTIHHNLFAHHQKRAPIGSIETLDHRNNVIYNMLLPFIWSTGKEGGEPIKVNLVNNHFKAGPNVARAMRGRNFDRLNWNRKAAHLYASGNYLGWMGKVVDSKQGPKADKPWPAPPVGTQSHKEAYELVLKKAGCFPRDAVSERTIEEVRKGAGQWKRREPEGGLMAGLEPGAAPKDSDGDGTPDAWERAHKLDPKDPRDANRIVPAGASEADRHKGYTWIEFYINDLADALIPDDE
jgi:pectate lyase